MYILDKNGVLFSEQKGKIKKMAQGLNGSRGNIPPRYDC